MIEPNEYNKTECNEYCENYNMPCKNPEMVKCDTCYHYLLFNPKDDAPVLIRWLFERRYELGFDAGWSEGLDHDNEDN
jgi:hypothetical protein